MNRNLLSAAIFFLFLFSIGCKKHDDIQPKETVVYQTHFDTDDGNWPVGKFPDIDGNSQIQNGYYQLTNRSTTNAEDLYTSFSFGNNVNNCAIEASVILAKVNSGDNFAGGGLIWNYNLSTNARFRFSIYTDGFLGIYGTLNNGNRETYKEMTSDAVRPGQPNVLRIELRSGLLHFLINGTEVYSMKPVYDNSLDQAGFTIPGPSIMKVDYFKAIKL